MAHSVLPYDRLLGIDERLRHAAARPVIVPDTIVIDHGSVFVSGNFRASCRHLGISIQPAHLATGSDNAYAERWVRIARSECTDRMLITGPRHLRAILDEYVTHYNVHRPHRARNPQPPDHDDIVRAPVADLATARIRRRSVLGGLIREYKHAA